MREFENEIQVLVYDEFGDVLDKKDEEIEEKNKELGQKDKEIDKLNYYNNEFKKRLNN